MKFSQKDYLTTETLRKEFPNPFQLATQAIELCRYYIHSGSEVSMNKILEEVQRNPHAGYLKDLMALEHEEEEPSQK